MYAEERQQAIARLVSGSRRLSVADLAGRFGVTTETVRRDLSTLERAGLVRRVHGGVVPPGALSILEQAVTDRESSHAAQKDRIARAAFDLLPDECVISIDAGTTTARLARLIARDSSLTVVTHCVPVAAHLAGHPSITLRLLPGRVRPTTQAAVGEDTVEALQRLRTDLAFIGTNGFSLGHGLSTPDLSEAAVKRAMVASAHRVVALADSSKFGHESTVRFAELASIDVLITDTGLDPRAQTALTDRGIEVIVT